MYSAIERLQELRVADVMTKSVVQVPALQSMCEAAALFRAHDVSAAPVVDEQGFCVGILSATDFLSRDSGSGHKHAPVSQNCTCHVSSPAEDAVSHWMTDAVQSVSPYASLAMAARIMCAQHVHRLVVIDKSQRVIGMVSTMDVVAALVNVLDEMYIVGRHVHR